MKDFRLFQFYIYSLASSYENRFIYFFFQEVSPCRKLQLVWCHWKRGRRERIMTWGWADGAIKESFEFRTMWSDFNRDPFEPNSWLMAHGSRNSVALVLNSFTRLWLLDANSSKCQIPVGRLVCHVSRCGFDRLYATGRRDIPRVKLTDDSTSMQI